MEHLYISSEIDSHLNFIKNLYDIVRIVNPKTKEYFFHEDEKIKLNCYEFWKKSSACQNCISARAFNENKTYIKIEIKEDKVYMMTSTPISLNGEKVILELLKDITKTMIVEDIEDHCTYIYDLLNSTNELSVKDPLTNIYNKRYINERLPYDILKNKSNKKEISIIMADIDHFKKVNDTYGHLVGDFILKEFVKELLNEVQCEKHWIGRFGGEEFLVCLNNTDDKQAFNIAEKMRKRIESKVFCHNNDEIKITASFGVTTMGTNKLTVEEFIDNADKNLYKAKQQGRNKVILDF